MLPISGTPFYSFLLPFFFALLEDGSKYVISCVIQHEAGGLSKKGEDEDDKVHFYDFAAIAAI